MKVLSLDNKKTAAIMCYNNIEFRRNITNTQGATHNTAVHIFKTYYKEAEIA